MVVLLHTSFKNWNLNRISQLIHMYMFYTVTTTVTKVPEAQVDMQEHCLHMPFTGTAAAYKMFGHAHHLRVPQHGFSDLVSMAIAEQHSLRSNSQASIPSRSKLMVAVAHGHMLFSVVTSVPCPNPCCCNVHHQRFLLEVHRCPSMSLNRCD